MTYWPPAPVVTELHQMVTSNIVRLKCLHIQGKIFLRQKNMKRKSGVQILECALLSQDQGYHLHFQCREMRRLLLTFETKRRRFQWQETALEISPMSKVSRNPLIVESHSFRIWFQRILSLVYFGNPPFMSHVIHACQSKNETF